MSDVKDEVLKMEFTPEEIKREIIAVYEEYLVDGASRPMKRRADAILEKLFRTPHNYSIPMSFIETEVGRLLLKIKLDVGDTMLYGATEIAIVADRSRSWVNKAIQSKQLEGDISSGRFSVKEDNLFTFLTKVASKPLDEKVAKERMAKMHMLKEQGASVEEMKKEFDFKKSLLSHS